MNHYAAGGVPTHVSVAPAHSALDSRLDSKRSTTWICLAIHKNLWNTTMLTNSKRPPCEPEMNSAVSIALASQPAYTNLTGHSDAPELPDGYIRTVAQQAVRELLRVWG